MTAAVATGADGDLEGDPPHPAVAGAGDGDGAPGRTRHRAVRAACDVLAVLPFVVAAVIESAKGWEPTSDNAIITTRAWDALGPVGPLVGQTSSASGARHPVYDLGPLLYWFLTLPVHLDHRQGSLWGAAALCAAAALLTVEAAWAARGWVAAAVATAAVLVVVVTQTSVAVDPMWNPDIGALWCLATVACAWAVALGRFRWFPVLVLAGSFAAQAHLMFAAIGLSAVVVAPVVGIVRRRGIAGRWWLPAGAAVAIACWTAPVVQQLTGSPGNLSSVLDWQAGASPLGYRFGLQALGTTIGAHPIWLTRPSGNAFAVYGDMDYHPAWMGVAALVGLAAVVLAAALARRFDLATLAGLTLLFAGETVVTIARIPYGSLLTLVYLCLVVWVVGLTIAAVAGWSLAVVVTAVVRSLRRRDPVPPGPGGAEPSRRWPATLVGALLAGLAAVAVATTVADTSGDTMQPGGWPAVDQVDRVAPAIESLVPRGPVVVSMDRNGGIVAYDVYMGLVWRLRSDGWTPEIDPAYAPEVDPTATITSGHPVVDLTTDSAGAVVAVHLRPGRPTRPTEPTWPPAGPSARRLVPDPTTP